MSKATKKRKFTSDNPCRKCDALCCRYVALPIDKPKTPGDFNDIRWYLLHENVEVFVEEGDWYVEFKARCKALGPDRLCKVYETRPRICRQYKTGSCEYYGENADDDEPRFKTVAQIEAYARKFLAERRRRQRRKSRKKA
jgi:Fe-S-cluster containining protein